MVVFTWATVPLLMGKAGVVRSLLSKIPKAYLNPCRFFICIIYSFPLSIAHLFLFHKYLVKTLSCGYIIDNNHILYSTPKLVEPNWLSILISLYPYSYFVPYNQNSSYDAFKFPWQFHNGQSSRASRRGITSVSTLGIYCCKTHHQ
jgi:hypothetical protein